MSKLKCWKNQTTKTQKNMGGVQFINILDNTQVSVDKFDFSPKPKNYQIQITSVSEARKNYPHSKVGITKKEAIKRLNFYMKSHNKC